MSEQEAIEMLDSFYEMDEMYISAQIGIKALKKQINGGWIPVTEKLPENNRPVMCWVKSTTIAAGETYIFGSCNNGFWFMKTYEIGRESFPVKDYEVIAWQPLPEPYKEQSNEA